MCKHVHICVCVYQEKKTTWILSEVLTLRDFNTQDCYIMSIYFVYLQKSSVVCQVTDMQKCSAKDHWVVHWS